MKLKVFWIFAVLIIFFFTNCKKEREWNADISNININLTIKRFDKELCTTPLDSIYVKYPQWRKEYGNIFLEDYFVRLLGVGLPEQKNFRREMRKFFEYCNIFDLQNEVEKVFPENDDFIRKSLEKPFKRFKYYFPDKMIPKIYTVISGFQISVFSSEGYVGISLDRYLGKDYDVYKQMFENYIRRRMFKEMLPVDVMKSWLIAEFPYNDSSKNLMTKMIYEGRLQYALDVLLPETADTLKWGYTYMQWGWANAYEDKIWNYLVDQKILFSTDDLDIKNFTGEAPFTTVFTNNSAPRTGTFIGYKIVKSYMNNHPEVSLEELMKQTDYMKIYNEAYYNP